MTADFTSQPKTYYEAMFDGSGNWGVIRPGKGVESLG
jgi:hypothetical protein